MIGVVLIAGRPALYLLIGLIAAALLLIGYVITSPASRDQPFRRLYALLYLALNRRSAPSCPHLTDHPARTPVKNQRLPKVSKE
jgi:hypothetical protein